MSKHYDHLLDLTLDTTIKEEKDGYYAFEDTVFYGEKGGMPSDKGKINGLDIIDLKWEGETLYHKVDGVLENPIHLEVDEYTRVLNTQVQSAFHLLDGYYAKLGLYLVAVGVSAENQWYEVNSKELDEKHFEEVQKFMNHALLTDIPSTYTYYKGSEYSDPNYAKFDEVRVVSFGDIDSQPCGTPHVDSTNQIGSFVILGTEKTSRGTRVTTSVGLATNEKLIQEHHIIQQARKSLNVKEHEIVESITNLVASNKAYKKQLDALNKELLSYKVNDLLKLEDKILIDVVDAANLRAVSQMLMNQLQTTKVLVTAEDNMTHFAIVSPENKARDIFASVQEKFVVSGGGSPKIVSGKTEANKEEVIACLQENL